MTDQPNQPQGKVNEIRPSMAFKLDKCTESREFWLCGEPNEHDVGIWYDRHPGVGAVSGKEFHRHHVIEKSAYDSVVKQLEACKVAYDLAKAEINRLHEKYDHQLLVRRIAELEGK